MQSSRGTSRSYPLGELAQDGRLCPGAYSDGIRTFAAALHNALSTPRSI